MDQIGGQKKTLNTLAVMDDYQTLKLRSEIDKVRRKNYIKLAHFRNESS